MSQLGRGWKPGDYLYLSCLQREGNIPMDHKLNEHIPRRDQTYPAIITEPPIGVTGPNHLKLESQHMRQSHSARTNVTLTGLAPAQGLRYSQRTTGCQALSLVQRTDAVQSADAEIQPRGLVRCISEEDVQHRHGCATRTSQPESGAHRVNQN